MSKSFKLLLGVVESEASWRSGYPWYLYVDPLAFEGLSPWDITQLSLQF